jgi:hypothetical protein
LPGHVLRAFSQVALLLQKPEMQLKLPIHGSPSRYNRFVVLQAVLAGPSTPTNPVKQGPQVWLTILQGWRFKRLQVIGTVHSAAFSDGNTTLIVCMSNVGF